jgi:hypothetical protein
VPAPALLISAIETVPPMQINVTMLVMDLAKRIMVAPS